MNAGAVPQVLIAIRRVEGVWECAVLTQGNLDRTLTGGELPDLIARALAPFMDPSFPDDTRVMLTYNISIPGLPQEEPRVVRP